MSKQRKGNKEAKKKKTSANEVKKQKKDPRRHDSVMRIMDQSRMGSNQIA